MSLATIPISDRLPASTRIYQDQAMKLKFALDCAVDCIDRNIAIPFGSDIHRDLMEARIIARQTVEDFGKAGG